METLTTKINRIERMIEGLSAFVYNIDCRMILDSEDIYKLHQEIARLQRVHKKLQAQPIYNKRDDSGDYDVKIGSKINKDGL